MSRVGGIWSAFFEGRADESVAARALSDGTAPPAGVGLRDRSPGIMVPLLARATAAVAAGAVPARLQKELAAACVHGAQVHLADDLECFSGKVGGRKATDAAKAVAAFFREGRQGPRIPERIPKSVSERGPIVHQGKPTALLYRLARKGGDSFDSNTGVWREKGGKPEDFVDEFAELRR